MKSELPNDKDVIQAACRELPKDFRAAMAGCFRSCTYRSLAGGGVMVFCVPLALGQSILVAIEKRFGPATVTQEPVKTPRKD